jgi:hypothetical protein
MMTYPSDWERIDRPPSVDMLVSFYSPPQDPDAYLDNLVVSVGEYTSLIKPEINIHCHEGGLSCRLQLLSELKWERYIRFSFALQQSQVL